MDYTIIRSKRKTLALEITRDAGLVVRAPARCPLKDIGLFVENHRDWIELHREKRLKHMEKYPEPTAAELEALREQAKSLIPQRVAHYAGVMGLTPAAVKINAAKTRFGSCSQRDSLNFSCRLMLYPQAAIDYVVVHELAHITHKNHGAGFYALVGSILPDYARRKALLRRG